MRQANMNYLIWWLSQSDCEKIGSPVSRYDDDYDEDNDDDNDVQWLDYPQYWGVCIVEDLPLPDYLKVLYRERYGRPGRGRLWIPSFLDSKIGVSISEQVSTIIRSLDESKLRYAVNDLDSPLYSKYLEKCGGLVFSEEDWHSVKKMPGLITHMDLSVLRSPKSL